MSIVSDQIKGDPCLWSFLNRARHLFNQDTKGNEEENTCPCTKSAPKNEMLGTYERRAPKVWHSRDVG